MDRRHWGLAMLMGGIHFSFHVFVRLLPPLLPVLAVALGYPLWKLGLLVSWYFAGSSIGLIPMGVLSDRYDRQATLASALAVVGVGYVVFAMAPILGAGLPSLPIMGHTFDGPFTVMAVAMLISGVGTSAHIPVGVPLLTANASAEHRGKLLGVWGGGSKLGDAAGPALVGVLILAMGWRPIIMAFGMLGVVGGGLLFLVLEVSGFDTRPSTDRTETDATGRTSRLVVGDRRRYLYPMLALLGYFAAYNLVVQGAVTFVPTFVTDTYGYTLRLGSITFAPASFASFVLSVLLIAAAISRIVGGILVDRYEHRSVMCGSLIVAAVALYSFATLSLGPVALVAVLVVFGAGLWGNSPARDSLISDLTPDAREGRTFSYLWTASRIFGALAPVLVGVIAETLGLRLGFAALSVVTFAAALFVGLLFSDRVYIGGEAGPIPGD